MDGATAWPDRGDLAVAGGLAASAFAAYVATGYRHVPGGDAGELIGAIATGGVIHPPGYPLYALLGHLFALLPAGSLAWRVGLLSAVSGALASGVLVLVLAGWTRSRWAAAAGGALFAFAPGVWAYAIGAEVFALDNLFVALLLLLAFRYGETRDPGFAYAASAVFGLGLCNHQTLLFTGAPVAAWILWTGGSEWTPRRLVGLAGCLLVGLTPYLDLVVEGRHAAAVTWGATQTWPGFWTHVLRREYGTFRLSVLPSHADGVSILGSFVRDLHGQLDWLALGLAVVGAAVTMDETRKRPGAFGTVCLLSPLVSVATFAALGNLPTGDALHREILARFWQQPEIYACAFAARGLSNLGKGAPRWRFAIPAVSSAVMLIQPLDHLAEMDRHDSDVVERYGAEILRPLPPGTLLLTRGDLITNTVRYLQVAEGLRPDVRVVDRELLAFPWAVPRLRALYPELVFPGAHYAPGRDGFSLAALADANLAHRPVVVCGGTSTEQDGPTGYDAFWPLGLCEAVRQPRAPLAALPEPDVDAWDARSAAALPRIDFRGQPHPPGSWEDVVWGDIWAARQARALWLLEAAGRDPARRRYLVEAVSALEGIVAEDPRPPPQIWRSLAMADGRLGLDTPAERARTADAWRHYLAVAPAWDPGLPAIRSELERLEAPEPSPR